MLFATDSGGIVTVLLVSEEADIHMHKLCKQGDGNGLTVTDRRREILWINQVILSYELHITFSYVTAIKTRIISSYFCSLFV